MNVLKFWNTDSFEISSYRYGISERKNSTYTTSGTDTTGKCLYQYNELGFRGDSMYKQGFKILSIGDSNTEGVGLNNNDTWSSRFSNFFSNGVNMNFGTGGRSNDFIARCLLTYFDLIKPDLGLVMYTSPQRREVYTKYNTIEPFMPTASWGYTKETEEGQHIQKNLIEIQNDGEDFVNWYKNHLLIKYFLQSKNCNWLWNGWMLNYEGYDEFNRYDGDYGKFLDYAVDGTHPGILHNRLYSKNLVNHIKLNFLDYIPINNFKEDANDVHTKLF